VIAATCRFCDLGPIRAEPAVLDWLTLDPARLALAMNCEPGVCDR
jgi:hypothetical protein